jgi:signal transduction histidine kinase
MLYDFTTQCVPLSGLLWCLPGVVWNQFYAGFRFAPTLRRACIQALDLLRVPKNAWILAQLLPALVFFLGFPYRLEAYLYVCLPYWALLMEWGLPRSRGSAWVAGVSGIFFGSVFFLISVILTLSGMLAWSVGVLIAVASVVLVGVAVEFFRPHRSVHLGGDFSSQFKSAVRWQRFAWGAFFLVVAIRAGATSLGERDISFFRQFMGQHSQVGLGVYDARRDIWHERPALGVAVHKYSHALLDPQAAVDWLSSGGVVVFDDTYVEGDLLKVRSLLDKKKAQGVAMEVHEVAWRRSRRALFLPSWEAIKKLVSRNDRSGSQEWTKEYRILYR